MKGVVASTGSDMNSFHTISVLVAVYLFVNTAVGEVSIFIVQIKCLFQKKEHIQLIFEVFTCSISAETSRW